MTSLAHHRGVARRISSPMFVGRRAELAELDEAFTRAAGGDPSLVLVAGEAGVGKSRLVAELAHRVFAGGAWALTGGCLDVGDGGLPYAPIAQALRGMTRELDPDVRGRVLGPSANELAWLAPDLGARPAAGVEPSSGAGRHARLLDAVLATLGRASLERPLALILEDLHWADGSTRDLLQFIVRNLRDERLLLVGTYRSDDLHRRHPLRPWLSEMERSSRVERLEIPRFDRAELAEQLVGILGETPPTSLVDRLLERSDGLPFYVEELVAGGKASSSMPATLRDILGQRLTSLSDAALDLLRSASVIGGRFDLDRLAAVVDMDDPAFLSALHEVIESGIVLPLEDDGAEPAYVFRHALLREAAMDLLLPTERVRLHARLADHLEQSLRGSSSDDPSLIADFALHTYHAHDQPRALEASVRALRALVAATAYPEAFGHAERALELWPRVVDAQDRAGIDHAGLLGLAARIAAATSAPDRAVAFSKAALGELEGSGARLRQAELYTELHMFAWEAQDLDTYGAAAERAYELVADSPASSLKANAMMVLGSSRWWDDRMIESADLFEEARAIALQVGDDQVWAEASAALAHTLADAGQAERAAELVDRSAEIEARFDGRPDSLWAAMDRCIALWTAGRFEDGLQTASNALDQAIRYGWGARAGDLLRSCIVDALFELGRYDEAEVVARPILADRTARQANMWVQQTSTRIAVARGRSHEAHRLVVGLVPTGSVGFADAWQATVLAEVARADGRFDDIVQVVDSAATVSPGGTVCPQWLLLGVGIGAAADRAVAARRRRKPGEATAIVERADRWLTALRSIASSARAQGGAGQFLEGTIATAEAESSRLRGVVDAAAWSRAETQWIGMSHQYMSAYTGLRLGEALLASHQGRPASAAALRAARATASGIGASGLITAIDALAASGRLDIGADEPVGSNSTIDGRPNTSISVTRRERDVLRLVAQGHTNREIGERLFISEKTVSVHVSNAMTKLGSLSRYEAAASASSLGLLQ